MNRIYIVLITFVSFLLLGCNAFQTDISTERTENSYQSLNEIIPQKYEIEDKIEGNFNLDEFADEVVLIRMLKNDERRLVILLGKEDGKFSLLLNSNKIILTTDKSSNVDPYLELKQRKGEFSVRHMDVENSSCLIEHTFVFYSAIDGFKLNSIAYTNCENDADNYSRSAKDFGSVNLNDFDIHKTY